MNRIEQSPDKSFPSIFTEEKELDAFYRLMNNPRMETQPLSSAVCQAGFQRVGEFSGPTLAIHDTTEFSFASLSELSKTGRISGTRKGFFGHFCLAAEMNGHQLLGVLGLKTWSRPQKRKGIRLRTVVQADRASEGRRWRELVSEVQDQCPSNKTIIHVMDREADDYTALSWFHEHSIRFVMRVKYDRKILDEKHRKLFDSLREAKVECTREVPLQARRHQGRVPLRDKKDHPERNKRTARLGVSAQEIRICRGSNAKKEETPQCLRLHFVRVFEIQPPQGEIPIEWILVTSEPIESEEEILQVIDICRARWMIEEYFKALKTGCAFEQRGFETIEALVNCLWIFAPIACQIYNLKTLARTHPRKRAEEVLNPRQIQILAHSTGQPLEKLNDVESAMLAVAKIGGHLKRNGWPGWQILTRGYEKLLSLEQGWILAQSAHPGVAGAPR